MQAQQVMISNPCAAHIDELIEKVIIRMRDARLRMLPVTDQAGVVVGVVSTFSILEHIIPNYLVSGDLTSDFICSGHGDFTTSLRYLHG